MRSKTVYQLSARQVLFLGIASALVAVGVSALAFNFGSRFLGTGENAVVSFAESAPAVSPTLRQYPTSRTTSRFIGR